MTRTKQDLLREYIRRTLAEAPVVIDGDEYRMSDAESQEVVTFITAPHPHGMGINAYNMEDTWLDSLIDMGDNVADKFMATVENGIPPEFQDIVTGFLADEDPKALAAEAFGGSPDGTVTVPKPFLKLAHYRTSMTSGVQVGRGELVVPFLFPNSAVNPEPNAPYDVSIDGQGWHVKEGSPTSAIRMGSARDKLITNSSVYRWLVRHGEDPSTFNDLGVQAIAKALPRWLEALGVDSAEELLEMFSKDARKIAIGQAMGILWFNKNTFIFTPKEELYMHSITMGRFRLTSSRYPQLRYLKR